MKSPEGVGQLKALTQVSQSSRSDKARRGTHTKNIYIRVSIGSGVGEIPISPNNNMNVRVGPEKTVKVLKKNIVVVIIRPIDTNQE